MKLRPYDGRANPDGFWTDMDQAYGTYMVRDGLTKAFMRGESGQAMAIDMTHKDVVLLITGDWGRVLARIQDICMANGMCLVVMPGPKDAAEAVLGPVDFGGTGEG
jgi:hypothetical protein